MSLVASIPYRLANLGNLPFGHSLTVSSSILGISRSMESVASPDDIWSAATTTPPGVYNIHQLVVRTSPLLDAIVARLGPDTARGPPAREVLIDGLHASLATAGRESTFPLTPSQDRTRTEIIIQAHRIAKAIISYVRDAPSRDINPRLQIRSPCEGHLWTPAVAALLTGPRGNAQLMELYNEWLHRMILLRDSLLPFENFADVPLVIPESSSRGIRDFEDARKLFLVQCMTGAVQHQAIVDLAKVFTSRGLPRGGYGFQYAHGLVLPAFLSGSSSIHLLRYHPARLDDSTVDLLLDYEHKEYINAPRTVLQNSDDDDEDDVKSVTKWNLSSLLPFDSCALQSSSIAIDSTHNDSRRRIVRLQLTLESGICIAVDLGQITRGRRYAYELQVNGGSSSKPNGTAAKTNGVVEVKELPRTLVHKVADILSQPGLVISPRTRRDQSNAIHVIPVADPIIKLALLGKLYPENVILVRDQDSIESVTKTGKGFSERFVILDGQSAF